MTRKARRQQKRDAANTFLPPEGVPLNLRIAGIGVRLGAQITDILLTSLVAGSILLFLSFLGVTTPSTLIAIGSLLFFLIRVPYYVLIELLWNGQTMGKRLMGIKVISHDGGTLKPHAVVLRNFMKEAEVFLPGTLLLTLDAQSPVTSWIAMAWIVGTLLVPILDVYCRRLGDLMAGTHVVHLPEPVMLKDLVTVAPRIMPQNAQFEFMPHHLDQYGAFELQTLEDLLRAPAGVATNQQAVQRRATMAVVVEKIRKKIRYADPVAAQYHSDFLAAFYKAQRQYLEQRQIFGDKRVDKFHSNDNSEQ